ncbi:MAG TPA: hypothetical protein VIF15_20610 [Polyangiaceae bacterium]|jgi:hypothetical protein
MEPRTARVLAPLAIAAAVHALSLPALAQPRPSGAQPSKDLIQRGQDLFEEQRYEESVATLSGALVKPTNTRAQKIEILRLLALDHITLGPTHKEEAEASVRGLLALQPDYELPRSESPRFRDFFAAVRVKWEAEGRPGLVTEQNAPKAVTIKHSSPSQADAGTEVTLTATLDDPDHRAAGVELFYRTGSSGKFSEVTTQFDAAARSVRATLPPDVVKPPFVAYYLLARDGSGLPVASNGDADAPLRIPVPEPSKGWVLPVAIGGGVLGAAGIVLGSLALAGAFKGNGNKPQSTVNIGVMTFR